jgi:hypothetical protein
VRNFEVLKDKNRRSRNGISNFAVEEDAACDHQATTDLSGQRMERTTLQPPERDIMLVVSVVRVFETGGILI